MLIFFKNIDNINILCNNLGLIQLTNENFFLILQQMEIFMKQKTDKIEEWNPKGIITQESIDQAIESFSHFTFKLTHSNALSGGLIADKVDLDGYVCMSNVMTGNEYEIMDKPVAKAKTVKRINAVIDGNQNKLFKNVNTNDVSYIKQKLNTVNINQNLNLNVPNKRLKHIIIQDKVSNNNIENKELIILRSSGFAKILSKSLQIEKEKESKDKNIKIRKRAQLSFGGANPINIGINGYLMSNPLYFSAPEANKESDFNEAYKIHHNGLKLYDLINNDFLEQYYSYQSQINNKTIINSYLKEKEKQLINDLFYYIKNTASKKYTLLEKHKEFFPNKNIFSNNIMNDDINERLLAFYLIGKTENKDLDDVFINCFVSILRSKTFYINKKPENLLLTKDNEFNIRKILRELLWQNI